MHREFSSSQLRDRFAAAVRSAKVPNAAADGTAQQAEEAVARAAAAFRAWRDRDPLDRSKLILAGAAAMRSLALPEDLPEEMVKQVKGALESNAAPLARESTEAVKQCAATARKLKVLVAHLHDHYRYDLDALFSQGHQDLREELLSIHGIGPETADSIMLYAAGQPVFVVDGYTRRLCSRLGWAPEPISYDDLQALFEDNLPRETELFQEYHALIVQHAKTTCRKRPLCSDCPLLAICPVGQAHLEQR